VIDCQSIRPAQVSAAMPGRLIWHGTMTWGFRGAFRALLCCGGLELGYQFGGYASAVFDVDALCLGPLANLGGIQPVRLGLASAWGWPPGTTADPATGTDITRKCVPQLLGVLSVQVDLVLGAVQSEVDERSSSRSSSTRRRSWAVGGSRSSSAARSQAWRTSSLMNAPLTPSERSAS
jgi:hypothetical protein